MAFGRAIVRVQLGDHLVRLNRSARQRGAREQRKRRP